MNVETPIWQCCVMVNALFVVLIYQNVLTSFLLENCLSLFIYFSTFFIGKFLFPLALKMKSLINHPKPFNGILLSILSVKLFLFLSWNIELMFKKIYFTMY